MNPPKIGSEGDGYSDTRLMLIIDKKSNSRNSLEIETLTNEELFWIEYHFLTIALIRISQKGQIERLFLQSGQQQMTLLCYETRRMAECQFLNK